MGGDQLDFLIEKEGESLLNVVADQFAQGVILLDKEGKIIVYNEQARKIFGIDPRVGPGHPPGQILPGDMVIIVNSSLSTDDGNLKAEDLQALGIHNYKLQKEDAFLAVGEYRFNTKGLCKINSQSLAKKMILKTKWKNKDISAEIDQKAGQMFIKVNGTSYPFNFRVSAGHLVVLDGISGEVKFYQARGYTARGEDIRNLLMGKPFLAKGPQVPVPNLKGHSILDFHPNNEEIRQLLDYLERQSHFSSLVEYDINGVPVKCKVQTLSVQGKITTGLLLIEDISKLKDLYIQRDRALATVRRLENRLSTSYQKPPLFQKIVGKNPNLLQVIQMAERASYSNSTVLLLGESGTGKGLFAKAIHGNSARKDKPFIQVNCAAIPDTLLESELFGYQEGAFTGAKKSGKAGKFELANLGTLFLDEIGDMSLPLQAKLLHVLQDKVIHRLGSVDSTTLDVRIIAATNKNLEKAINSGLFRKDLFYRLNIIPILVPPLRKRRDDVAELIDYLLPLLAERVGKSPEISLSDEALRLLEEYDWPGNIRELENVLERCINLAEGAIIFSHNLPSEFHQNFEQEEELVPETDLALERYASDAEKRAIVNVLKQTNGNKTKAAAALNIARSTLYNKIERYQIKDNDYQK